MFSFPTDLLIPSRNLAAASGVGDWGERLPPRPITIWRPQHNLGGVRKKRALRKYRLIELVGALHKVPEYRCVKDSNDDCGRFQHRVAHDH